MTTYPVLRQVVLDTTDARGLAEFDRQLLGLVESLPPVTWPDGPHPQRLHLDCTVPDADELAVQHERALALGATLLLDRSDDPEEALYVYADPSGHPFCVFVG